MTHPRVEHTDRGKSAVVVPIATARAIRGAVKAVTGKWAKQRQREQREARAKENRADALRERPKRITIKDAAYLVMEQAYMKASANDTLPANARQIMYAARPSIQEMAGRDLDDSYFTQTLLPDYITEHGLELKWDVVYDDRGHFTEPHADWNVPLGTLSVRKYLRDIAGFEVFGLGFNIIEPYPTRGPGDRYGSVLFIEKEGFMPLMKHVELADRYDMAIMSTKGVSNTAARKLVDKLCAIGIRVFVLRDFDKSGFTIAGTLQRSTRRYQFGDNINVTDLGLRLQDIDGLETERVHHGKSSPSAVGSNLRLNGASEAEIAFLMTRRVELNALPSDELIAFIERKLRSTASQRSSLTTPH